MCGKVSFCHFCAALTLPIDTSTMPFLASFAIRSSFFVLGSSSGQQGKDAMSEEGPVRCAGLWAHCIL
jgi:hypothetical protein